MHDLIKKVKIPNDLFT